MIFRDFVKMTVMVTLVVLGLFVLATRPVTVVVDRPFTEKALTSAIMEVDHAFSTREIDVTVTSTSKKREAESGLDHSVEVTFDIEGERVAKRFTRSPEHDDVKLYDVVGDDIVLNDKWKRDWATYIADDGQGAILVTRDADNKLTTEGILINNDQSFFVQPSADSGRHVMHRLTTKRDAALETTVPKVMTTNDEAKRYTVELAWVIDPKAYEICGQHAKVLKIDTDQFIRKHLTLLLAAVNQTYSSLQRYRSYISVKSAGVVIIKDFSNSPYSRTLIKTMKNGREYFNGKNLLNSFKKWVDGQKVKGKLKVDAIQLLTGYENRRKSTKGTAKSGGTCRSMNVGVVLYSMGLRMAVHVAHELGHSLGMRHDEINDCSKYNNYVMSGKAIFTQRGKTALNPWKFTWCSNRDFREYISGVKKENKGKAICLETSEQITNPLSIDANDNLWGHLETWDKQCAFLKKGSQFCPDVQLYLPVSRICAGLYCGIDARNCRPFVPYDKTQCGNNTVCRSGRCVVDTTLGKPLKTNCIYGDLRLELGLKTWVQELKNMTCAQAVKKSPSNCYNIEHLCCESCAKHADRTSPACKYGNQPGRRLSYKGQKRSCTYLINDLNAGKCYQQNIQDKYCCETCRIQAARRKGTTEKCKYGDYFDIRLYGIDNFCGYINELAAERRHSCYDRYVNLYCCATCTNLRIPGQPANCLYGDRKDLFYHGNTKGCMNVTAPLCRANTYIANNCCDTCRSSTVR